MGVTQQRNALFQQLSTNKRSRKTTGHINNTNWRNIHTGNHTQACTTRSG